MRIVAVDWSGAATTAGQRRHIWAATVEDGRLVGLRNARTREELIDELIRTAQPRSPLVVGLDFAFSFPAWLLREEGMSHVAELWEVAAREGEQWLARCPYPFWGRPGTRRPGLPQHFRATDVACPPVRGIRPKSVFQIGGAGAVGTGSIRGMPHLQRLRAAGFAIWPFDPPDELTVVEVYPRALTGPVTKSDPAGRARYLAAGPWYLCGEVRRSMEESDDAFDAGISALVMGEHADELSGLSPIDHPDVHLEGWIWAPKTAE